MRYAALLFSLVLLAAVSFAVTLNPCPDNTPYGRCSNATPGMYCTGAATGTNIPHLETNYALCTCPAGWNQNGTSGCARSVGCAYDNPRCNTTSQICNASTGQCDLKRGCLYNPLDACDASYDCTNNTCVLKSGCKYRNPDCNAAQGMICDQDTNQCEEEPNWCDSDTDCTGMGEKCVSNHCSLAGLGGTGGSTGNGGTGGTGAGDIGDDWGDDEQPTKAACCCPGFMILLAGAALVVARN